MTRKILVIGLVAVFGCTGSGSTKSIDNSVEVGGEPECDGDECSVCLEEGFWVINEAPEEEDDVEVGTDELVAMAPPPVDHTLDILEDGTAVIRDASGKEVRRWPKAATKVGGQWIWNPKDPPTGDDAELLKRCKIGKIAKCIGVTFALIIMSELANAGVEAALGPAAAAMGVRLQDCQDRFAKIAMGIACLRRQGGQTCAKAVENCPDAFFGANTVMSCGAEPGMNDFVDALVGAIRATSTRAGGRGYPNPDATTLIADAIRSGTIATDPGKTCTMRATVATVSCKFHLGSIFPPPAGFEEAKTCWDNATKGIFETKREEARKCCTTDQCRGFIDSLGEDC